MKRLLAKLGDHLRLHASHIWTPRDRLKIKQTRIGACRLVVAVNEDVGREIYYRGTYEPSETQFLMGVLREDDVCFDLGANVGYFTTLMATISTKGAVHAFEPDPFNFALLNVNIQINRFRNVILNQIAIGDKSGHSPFVLAKDHAFSSLKNTGRTGVQEVVDVSITTLDDYVRGSAIQRMDFLKIDVEGAEGSVIDGASHCLTVESLRPRLMMIELVDQNQAAFGNKVASIETGLRQLGYEPFIVKDGHKEPFVMVHHNKYRNVFFSRKA